MQTQHKRLDIMVKEFMNEYGTLARFTNTRCQFSDLYATFVKNHPDWEHYHVTATILLHSLSASKPSIVYLGQRDKLYWNNYVDNMGQLLVPSPVQSRSGFVDSYLLFCPYGPDRNRFHVLPSGHIQYSSSGPYTCRFVHRTRRHKERSTARITVPRRRVLLVWITYGGGEASSRGEQAHATFRAVTPGPDYTRKGVHVRASPATGAAARLCQQCTS